MKNVDTGSLYKVKFSKVKNSHSRLRGDEIVGYCASLPVVGSWFLLIAEPLEDTTMDFRQVNTSVIDAISRDGNKYTVTTRNESVYLIEVLEEPLSLH